MCQAPSPVAEQPPLTRAEREAMLAAVEKPLLAAVRKSVLACQFDDVMQDVRLLVWQKSEEFDPARGVKWVSYAVGIAKRHCQKVRATSWVDPIHYAQMTAPADNDEYLKGQSSGVPEPDDEAAEQEDDERESAARDDDAAGAEAVRAVREVAAAPMLAVLSPDTRAVVAPIVLDGLTPAQVADQVGRSVKDVKLFIRNAAKAVGIRFAEAGKALGLAPAKRKANDTGRQPRAVSRSRRCRELEPAAIAALHEIGPSVRTIAARIGVNPSTLAGWPGFREAFDRMTAEFPSLKAFRFQATAIEVLKECGPVLHQIANRVGVGGSTLLRWPAFRAAFDAAKAAAGPSPGTKRERLEATALAMLAEVGPNLTAIAAAVGVCPSYLGDWPAFRQAFDRTRATAGKPSASEPRQEPTPAGRMLSGHGWHFGRRMVPGSAKALLADRGRNRVKR